MELLGYIALAVMGITLGLVGAGGSILTIPILVYLLNVPIILATSYSLVVFGATAFMGFTMQEAVPTSLFIITVNSLIGFAADQHQCKTNDWSHLGKYLAPAFFGMLTGLYIAKFIQGEGLKKASGYFIWVVGIAILIKEFIL
ncbi:MAG: TSUP family transporter [Rickettsiaceae bacterium]|nr:TSUP family transporter [Rickettsiaceae bacterium]